MIPFTNRMGFAHASNSTVSMSYHSHLDVLSCFASALATGPRRINR